uniref:Uncharacterized protein n=1 Tax=Cryptomonas curvata TaxID=233186 RepID=A0A7S0QL40_9CRYP|mmetsp:Transcript_32999/g.69003  ORF Transcript_32999/g.69003 Transcript_32999/m.69003 type:complete len:788 (+) Transcript_32999:17-2380(+)
MENWSKSEVEDWLVQLCTAFKCVYLPPEKKVDGKTIVEWNRNREEGDLVKYLQEIGLNSIPTALSVLKNVQKQVSEPSDRPSDGDARSMKRRNVEKSDQAVLAAEFVAEYIDTSKIVEGFIDYATACQLNFFNSNFTFLSPYLTLVQSSGYGKTRLLRQVAYSHVMLYVCFRKILSTGYPPRTNKAISALFGGLNQKKRAAYVNELKRRLDWFVHNALTMKSQLLSVEGTQKPEVDALFPSERFLEVWDYPAKGRPPSVTSTDLVVLAFDEARECLQVVKEIGVSQFRLMRQALREFSIERNTRDRKIIGIFVDTSSRIQNFAPNEDDDPSARKVVRGHEIDYTAMKLFHPYILAASDVHFKPSSSEDILSLRTSREYLRVGRPLVTQSSIVDSDFCKFLQRKLYGGGSSLTEPAALGIMLSRVSAFVCPRHGVASDLVANHMATLLACDEERKGMLSTYVAEPRLAIAAADVWRDESVFSKHCIPALQKALMSGALSQGIRGEIVAQILLLLACDTACRRAGRGPGSCVSLSAVLKQLLPADTDDKLLREVIPECLKDAEIACCQFLYVAHQFTERTFFELAERHCGACLREGQRGADLVIPIIGKYAGYLIIQVKNLVSCQKDCAESKMVCQCLRPSYVFALDGMDNAYLEELDRSSVCLFMQLGAQAPSAMTVVMPEGLPSALEIFGIVPRCLSTCINHAAAVKMLVRGKVDLAGFIAEVNLDGPNPDAGGRRARNAWPFLIASRQSDRPEVAPSQEKSKKRRNSGRKQAWMRGMGGAYEVFAG